MNDPRIEAATKEEWAERALAAEAEPERIGAWRYKDGEPSTRSNIEMQVKAEEIPAARPWVQTNSGVGVDLIEPQPSTIRLKDIAKQLSRINRFSGATRLPLSVAEHSVNVMLHVRETSKADPFAELVALLHDAHEAYIGDVVTPLAQALDYLGGMAPGGVSVTSALLGQIKAGLDRAIATAFMLDGSLLARRADMDRISRLVKEADAAVLMAERRALLGTPPASWGAALENTKPSDVTPHGLGPSDAERVFYWAARRLLNQLNIPQLDPVGYAALDA